MTTALSNGNSAYAAAHERICADATAMLHWMTAQHGAMAPEAAATSHTAARATANLLSLATLIFTTATRESDSAFQFYEQFSTHMPDHAAPSEDFLDYYRAWGSARAKVQPSAAPTISIQALRRVRDFMEAM